MASGDLQAIHDHYNAGGERDRLSSPEGQLEFERTKEIIGRVLPAPGSTVADIGGGPGRYAQWLAELGYRVVHRDLIPLHVEQLSETKGADIVIDTAVADARELDLEDDSVDVALLLGPLYHLTDRRDRLQALGEARRVVRPGGPIVVAGISRWSPRLYGILLKRIYEVYE